MRTEHFLSLRVSNAGWQVIGTPDTKCPTSPNQWCMLLYSYLGKKTTSVTEKCNGTVIQVRIPGPKLSQDLHSPSRWTHTQMSSQQYGSAPREQLLFTSVAILNFAVVIFTFTQLTCAQ